MLSESKHNLILQSVSDGAYGYVLRELLSGRKPSQPLVFVAREEARMMEVRDVARVFLPEKTEILIFPAWDCLPYDRVSPNPGIVAKRIATLSRLAEWTRSKDAAPVVVTTVNALIQRVPALSSMQAGSFSAKRGERLNRETLLAWFMEHGYSRVGKVMEPGEYAIRGSIIDLYPSGYEQALRIDLFGDEIDTIREFDTMTQASTGHIDGFSLMPVSEVPLDKAAIERFRTRYHEHFGAVLKEDPLYEAISEGRKYPGMEHWLPFFHEKLGTLFDYLPEAIMVFDHLAEKSEEERQEQITDYYEARKNAPKQLAGQGAPYHPVPPEELYLSVEEAERRLRSVAKVELTPFEAAETHDREADRRSLGYSACRNFAAERAQGVNIYNAFRDFAGAEAAKKRKVMLACVTEGSRDRLRSMLADHDMHVVALDRWEEAAGLRGKTVGLLVLPVEHGFETPDFVIVSEQDLLGERLIRKPRRRRQSDAFLAEAAAFQEGDLVVHRDHGIGMFKGLQQLEVSHAPHDCLLLVYEGGDKLYVPVENFDLLTRYGAGDGEESEGKLDKLGGAGWQARKARAKERIKMAAEELLRIAAIRETREGEEMHAPHGLYDEFAARFPYAETDDQLRVIDEVLEDLGSGKPMDRLVCGDVGFGKTEVALRAAFVACQPDAHGMKRQVAIIAPTTLLVRQHYKTFRQRFAGMPVTVRQLSRMVPAKEARETKEMIVDGRADIVIGTHALLADKIRFRHLGLLVIDEEQRFGVRQKEKLKQLKGEVHVLTLSATPIPRTLQMSLAGLRTLSLITTPPVDRLAVRTFVTPFDPLVLREAILRERYRGGQVFYVVPRIKDLGEVKKTLADLVPEVKVAVAHGQMPPGELDTIMNDFYDGKYDVLLSTTIVESGLDIPNANTLIVHRSDMFGLAQLYQIRGRVGRGKQRAYAYLTLPHGKTLTKSAYKRLEVMQTLDTLGAGFTVASHDMDIRGYGNILGEEQSGNIKEVGVELYQQMLEDAVREAKASARRDKAAAQVVEAEEDFSPQINLGIPVLIPESYVEDLSLRLSLYRRLGDLRTKEELDGMAAELIDRFGALPPEVESLLEIVRIKQICRQAGVERVDAGPKGLVLVFHNNTFTRPDRLLGYISDRSDFIKLRPDQKLVILHEWKNPQDKLKLTTRRLEEIGELAAA